MDSEDERYMEEEERMREKLGFEYYRKPPIFIRRYGAELRLYEREEDEECRPARLALQAMHGAIIREPPDMQKRLKHRRRGVPYHVLRFYDIVKGFHLGHLDLSGRHEQRYASIMERFDAFHAQFAHLLQGHGTGRAIRIRTSSHGRADIMEVDGHLAEEFDKRWGINFHDATPYLELLDDVKSCFQKHHAPVFQQLRLCNLPNEILSCIMDQADRADALNMGATCRLLQTVSQWRIRRHRFVGIPSAAFILGFTELQNMSEDVLGRKLQSAALSARSTLADHVSIICSRPNVAQNITYLTLKSWPKRFVDLAEWDDEHGRAEFNVSVARHMEDILRSTSNVRQLTLSHVPITWELAEAICNLEFLRHLRIDKCHVLFTLSEVQCLPDSAVSHLTFQASDPIHDTCWYLLPVFQNLKWLNLRDYWDYAIGGTKPITALPSPFLLGYHNPFETLERVYIRHLQGEEMETLQWSLENAAPGNPLRLTHFKLVADDALLPHEVFSLITALSRAPLQYLSLHGVIRADLELFDHIVACLPDLVVLSIVSREEMETYTVVNWSADSWEYAARLAELPHLEYFGWNLMCSRVYSPAPMLRFETGEWDQKPVDPDAEEDESWEQIETLPKMFAACRPTLKSLAFFSHDGHLRDLCRLNPAVGVPFEIQSAVKLSDGNKYDEWYAAYDPPTLRSWPFFDPKLTLNRSE